MSSHREAPGISNDPAADNTDVYAFVSPDDPDTVTLIANFVPLRGPAGGPNFYEFGDDVLYEIHIDNDGDGRADISYRFRFTTVHATRTRSSTTSARSRRSTARTGTAGSSRRSPGSRRARPRGARRPTWPARRATSGRSRRPNYATLAESGASTSSAQPEVFTGQRAEGFYVDLGAIFDLGVLRPFQELHICSQMPAAPGINATKAKNVHTIALQVPKTDLTADGKYPHEPDATTAVDDRRVRQREPAARRGSTTTTARVQRRAVSCRSPGWATR